MQEIVSGFDDQTEVLTSEGFVYFKNLNNQKIASLNNENDFLIYKNINFLKKSLYEGKLIHFLNKKIDICITKNKKLFVSNKIYKYNGHRKFRKVDWSDFNIIEADSINLKDYSKILSKINWYGENIDNITIMDKVIPMSVYLEFIGYLVSEGCLYTNHESVYTIILTQSLDKYASVMKYNLDTFCKALNISHSEFIKNKDNIPKYWNGIIQSKKLFNILKEEIGSNNSSYSKDKQIPKNILNLNKVLLEILLSALIKGDGSIKYNKDKTISYTYYTTSKLLHDNIFEICLKCGYSPISFIRNSSNYLKNNRIPLYTICWSNTNVGNYPKLYKNIMNTINYDGQIYSLDIDAKLIVIRRNGKVSIQPPN